MMVLRFAIVLLLVSLSTQAWAERRVALVVGNSAYRYVVPLANPKNRCRRYGCKTGRSGL